jgi:hypothetical protein
MLDVSQHVAGRGHGVKKKVAEFQEMNSLVRRRYDSSSDVSVVNAWIKNLHAHDFLSSSGSQA